MNAQHAFPPAVREHVLASDLVGCRYRFVQGQRHPEVPSSDASIARAERHAVARQVVFEALPTRRGFGDGRSKPFSRIAVTEGDGSEQALDDAEFATLEAIAAEATLITGAVFRGFDEPSNQEWRVTVDVLVRETDGSGRYLPVLVSNHRVAQPDPRRQMSAIATNRLGLSPALEVNYRQRHHVADGYRLGLAARALEELGINSGRGGVIGQDRTMAFLAEDTSSYEPALASALEAGWAEQPRRVKECATCRFWPICEPELIAMDEISLVLPGDRARTAREKGITTVTGLIDADLGESSALARAYRDGIPLLARVDTVDGPRADVEIDVDMEAYLDQGAYLWGAFDGAEYTPFVTWEPLGGRDEARNFAQFWRWLMGRREAALSAGLSFAAYCYSSHGENHWLRASARRFGGMRIDGLTVPTLDEVDQFIASEHWVDVFTWVRRQLLGPGGIGLKTVAPEAGYAWADDGFTGEDSVDARRLALGEEESARKMREQLLRYNEDDTRATAQVRQWLRAGAPGVEKV